MPNRFIIAVPPDSALALWRAEHVRARLAAMHPDAEVGLLRVAAPPSAGSGGTRRAVTPLEAALADGRADLAVHALKDVPADLPEGFALAAVCARDDARDALVSNRYLDLAQLPGGARVGTSCPRRAAQLSERDPLLEILPLRGEVDARLRRLDEGRYDAIVVAAAALKRLGFGDRIASALDPEEMLPAPGQGALALECRADRPELIAALAPLADRETTLATAAERAFARALSGDCRAPLAAHALRRHGELWLRGLCARRDGGELVRGERAAPVANVTDAAALGLALAYALQPHAAQPHQGH